MNELFNKLAIFLEIDQTTYMMIAFFCAWAAYFVRAHLLNAATLVFLYPLFCGLAFSYYAGFLLLELFSPKRTADWIMYSVFAAAAGCANGIVIMSVLRRIQEVIIETAHDRRMALKEHDREAERALTESRLTEAEAAQQRTLPNRGAAPAQA